VHPFSSEIEEIARPIRPPAPHSNIFRFMELAHCLKI
jgi:hypothetical protein